MVQGLSVYAAKWIQAQGDAETLALDVPLLRWSSAVPEVEDLAFATQPGGLLQVPAAGDSWIFELRKDSTKKNPFVMGITLGRNENNDLVLRHSGISRFHAYFQREPKSGHWRLVDTGSKNGTWAAGLKLAPSQPRVLEALTELRVGDLQLTFYTPAAFAELLRTQMREH